MASLTIGIDGKGVIANCDSLTADTGGTGTGTWNELGGGTRSVNTDSYLQGGSSIGSTYASKSGYTYFDIQAGNELDFSGGGTEEGQYIFIWVSILSSGAFDTLANNGFSIRLGTSTTDYRDFKIAGSDDNNGWAQGWKLFVIDPTMAGSVADTGSYDPASIRTIGLWIDTIISVRADTVFIDQIAVGRGLRVTGANTLEALYEIVNYCTDFANRAWGMFQRRSNTFFGFGKLTIGDAVSATKDTDLMFDGRSLEYEATEFYNASSQWVSTVPAGFHGITVEKHASYSATLISQDTNIAGEPSDMLLLTNTNATGTEYKGGSLKYIESFALTTNDIYDGVVISKSKQLVPNGATITNCKIGTTLEDTTGSLKVESSAHCDLITNMQFEKYANSNRYAVYVDASVTAITLNNWVFDDPDNTVDFAVYWAGTGGTLTISATNGTNLVTAGCTSAGGTIDVQNSNTLTIVVTDETTGALLADARVHVVAGATGSMTEGDVIIAPELTGADGTVTGSINGSGQSFKGLVAEALEPSLYVAKPIAGTIPSGGITVNVGMVADE